jgi:hypothetical protein
MMILAFEALTIVLSVMSSAFYSSFDSFFVNNRGDGVNLPKPVFYVGTILFKF